MTMCQNCGELLDQNEIYSGGADECFCADCYGDYLIELNGYEEIYGLGPHVHDMNITGSIIGSTVLLPLPNSQDEFGWYKLEEGVFFSPDPEDPSCGIWRYYNDVLKKPVASWRDENQMDLPGFEAAS